MKNKYTLNIRINSKYKIGKRTLAIIVDKLHDASWNAVTGNLDPSRDEIIVKVRPSNFKVSL